MMSQSGFWETVVLNLLLPTASTKGGQCFLIPEKKGGGACNLEKGEIPQEIYPFSDNYIRPVLEEKTNILKAWVLRLPQQPAIIYMPHELIRIYLVDPKNPLTGQCPLWASMSAVRQDAKANVVNEKFFDNNASLGGSLQTDKEMGKDEIDAVLTSWQAKYGGSQNTARTAVLHSGLKYEQFQRTHVDMQFIEQKKLSREEILSAYKVPKSQVGIFEDTNYATAKASTVLFWDNTLIPLDNKILECLNSQWVQYIERDKYLLVTDYTKVKALQVDFKDKLEQAVLLFNLLVPMKEINRRLELTLNLEDYEWLNTSLVNYALTPAENIINPPKNEDTTNEDTTNEDTTNEDTTNEDTTNEDTKSQMYTSKSIEDVVVTMQLAVEERELYVDNYNNKVLKPDEEKVYKMATNFFIKQRNKYLNNIDTWYKDLTGETLSKKSLSLTPTLKEADPDADNIGDRPYTSGMKPDFSKIRLSVKVESKEVWNSITPLYKDMVAGEAMQMAEELGDLTKWKPDNKKLVTAIANRKPDIVGIPKTSNIRVNNIINKTSSFSIENKLSARETAKLLKSQIKQLADNPARAKTIARTEAHIIHSETRANIMLESGVELIEWLTARDEKVRGADDVVPFPHTELDGNIVNLADGEMFFNGENIKYPGAGDASAGNVINCRCTFRMVRSKK